MTAPSGAIVSLHYDTDKLVTVGDVITTRTGRGYVVMTARQQRRGKWTGRWHLSALVLTGQELVAYLANIPDLNATHQLYWYKRK